MRAVYRLHSGKSIARGGGVLFLALALSGFFAGAVFADSYNYTTLNVPGAAGTKALGISGNNIVGYYWDSNFVDHGFLYNGTNYTTLNVPGAALTFAWGISGNNIVGYYDSHGFRYNGTNYTTLNVPGAAGTKALGISGNNIVGYYWDSNFVDHGFLYNGTNYTTLNVPGASLTFAWGISGNNIVGAYQDATGKDHGFLYNGTTYQTLDAPAGTYTYAYSISGSNIVGVYSDATGNDHGFLATPSGGDPVSDLGLTPGKWAIWASGTSQEGFTVVNGTAGQIVQNWYANKGSGWAFDGSDVFKVTATTLQRIGSNDGTDLWILSPVQTLPRPMVLNKAYTYIGVMTNQRTKATQPIIEVFVVTKNGLTVNTTAGSFSNCVQAQTGV